MIRESRVDDEFAFGERPGEPLGVVQAFAVIRANVAVALVVAVERSPCSAGVLGQIGRVRVGPATLDDLVLDLGVLANGEMQDFDAVRDSSLRAETTDRVIPLPDRDVRRAGGAQDQGCGRAAGLGVLIRPARD